MTEYAELNCLNIRSDLLLYKNLIEYETPDYGKIIQALRIDFEFTHEKIADVLPVKGASTVSEWSRGGVPNYKNGLFLIELWKHMTNLTDEDLPRKNHYLII